ncbi:hypothetical protein [Flavobacterium chungangensis]|uniref:Uncharacterized protein n=1 Tax=Flavobacterium chungangensis TaxID=2708132 RepID=A0ABV8ZCB9_9FLAO
MKGVTKIIIIFCAFFFIQCKEKSTKSEEFINTKFKGNGVEYSIEFPDTVLRGKKYKGEIHYTNVLDTITESMINDSTSKRNRYIIFSMALTDNIDYVEKDLWKIAKDTFGAIDNHTIPFYDVKFNKSGTFFIDGVINDQGYITSDIKNEKGSYDTRIITNEFRATKKVVVIDKG